MATIPVLNSLPGAAASIYLDFNGHYEASWGSYSNITTPVYDSDGDPTSYGSTEVSFIEDVWRVVAEDFAPFKINVTTVEPSVLASGAPSSQSNGVAFRVAIGGNGLWRGIETGSTYSVNSFTDPFPNLAYVFTTASDGRQMSNVNTGNFSSNVSGASFGLQRSTDPNGDAPYYDFEFKWQSIMSLAQYGYDDAVWRNGLVDGGIFQDDMAMIARSQNGFGYRADDHANTITGATPLQAVGTTFVGQGVVGLTSDVDVFAINTTSLRSLKISVTGSEIGQNLDAAIELLDGAGNLVVRSDPSNSYDATLYGEVNGAMYIAVRANGAYGRVGQYKLLVEDSTPGVTFATPTSEPFTTSELGRAESFTLGLQSKPSADVVFDIASSNTLEGVVSKQRVTFTPANWYLPQTVMISGVSDSEYDSDQGYTVTISAATSQDLAYNGLFNSTALEVVNLDSAPGQLISTSYNWGAFDTVRSYSQLSHQNKIIVTLPSDANTLTNVAIDPVNRKVYWSDGGLDQISRSNLDGSVPEVVIAGLPSPKGLQIDAAAGKIYWADSSTMKIQRANLNGTGVEDLIATEPARPGDVRLDIVNGKIYWEADGGTHFVYRANLDGSQVEGVILNTGLGHVDALVLDHTQGKMYFSTRETNQLRLYRANLDGSDSEVIRESTATDSTIGFLNLEIDVDAQRIYWTDRKRIYSVNTNGQHLALVVPKSVTSPNYLVAGLAFVAALPGISASQVAGLKTSESGGTATFSLTLDAPPTADVTISFSSSDATEGRLPVSSLTFTPANWNLPQVVSVAGVNDLVVDGDVAYTINFSPAVSTDPRYSGMQAASVSVTNLDDDVLPTKFYVVNDATQNLTYEYNANGGLIESYSLNSGNTTPRGAASNLAGDKTWVVDANRKVYVYNNSGVSLGSWTAGTLSSTANVEGVTTNGTDVWIVDNKADRVYRYSNAAGLTSGSQNAVSSFALNIGNTNPKDIVTDGNSLWVVNDATTDKVFKYTLTGSLIGSWTIDSVNKSPTGITLDPSGASQSLWIVDSGTDRVYEYANARIRNAGSQAASLTFGLAAGNTNPQGIADPPPPATQLTTAVGSPSSKPVQPMLASSAPAVTALDAVFANRSERHAVNVSSRIDSESAALPSAVSRSSADARAFAPIRSHDSHAQGTRAKSVRDHDAVFSRELLADLDSWLLEDRLTLR